MLLASAALADVGIGDSRESVLNAYGKPTSIARRADHEIFMYPKGGRIELIDGKVADVKGPLPTPIISATIEPATPLPSGTPVSELPAAATKAAVAAKPAQPPPAAPVPAFNPAIAAHAVGNKVENMNSAWGSLPAPRKAPSALDGLAELFTGLLLRFAFTVVALKAAFKYWEMDAFWKGIFAIATIDFAVHAALKFLGPVTNGVTTMASVENGVTGVVLIFTIKHFCFNKRLQNAVVTAAAVKLVVFLCYIFGVVVLLNAIYR